jgi:hypothetical protein
VAKFRTKQYGLPWGKIWTQEDDETLKKLYALKTNEEIASALRRSLRAIERRARELGLRKDPDFFRYVVSRKKDRKPWMETELATLAKLYPVIDPEKIARILGRTKQAVCKKAWGLGLHQERAFAKFANNFQAKGIAEQKRILAHLSAQGWEVVEPENFRESYDAIIRKDDKTFVVNVKFGKKFTVTKESLERMCRFPYEPAILYVTPEGRSYFLKLTKDVNLGLPSYSKF